ncbi:hypothetical protein AOLI_G00225430 [Acnodon oligacanthus]
MLHYGEPYLEVNNPYCSTYKSIKSDRRRLRLCGVEWTVCSEKYFSQASWGGLGTQELSSSVGLMDMRGRLVYGCDSRAVLAADDSAPRQAAGVCSPQQERQLNRAGTDSMRKIGESSTLRQLSCGFTTMN